MTEMLKHTLQVKYEANRCPFAIGERVKLNEENLYVAMIEILERDGARYGYLIGFRKE